MTDSTGAAGKPGDRLRAIGLMSGTSMDGIDVAMIETDGQGAVKHQAAISVPYPAEFRAALREGLVQAAGIETRADRPGDLARLERELTERHAEAVLRLMGNLALQPFAVDVIGFHGQTVLHRPEQGLTVQLGDGALLASRTGIDVVYDMRAADLAARGQGAPLAPVYHKALAGRLPELPAAFLNLGGVANLTYVSRDGGLIAFDTGPGNALIDDWVLQQTGSAQDAGGRLAQSGRVDEDALIALLSHPYFGAPIPKSLDRNAFSAAPVQSLSPADGAATLTAFTAAAVHRALAFLPEPPRYWLVCGGGRRNKALMMALAGRLEAAVAPVEAVGLDGDVIEAEAWAYLAVRSLKGLPLSFPRTTGVAAPQTGGVLAKAPRKVT
jgi:anhydro-N-acetylmuramic acid kinase